MPGAAAVSLPADQFPALGYDGEPPFRRMQP